MVTIKIVRGIIMQRRVSKRHVALILVKIALIFSMNLGFTDESAAAGMFLGPYLQNPAKTRMTVMWITGSKSEGTVRYGTKETLNHKVSVSSTKNYIMSGKKGSGPTAYVYEAELADLKPGTVYQYEVSWEEVREKGSFRTIPDKPEPFTFIAYGDSRNGTKIHTKIASRFAKHNPAFILHTGDMIYGGNYAQWGPFFFEPLKGVISRFPLLPVIGNHEAGHERMGIIFNMPGGKTYYTFDYGDVHFICLNSGWEGMSRTRDLARQQLEWLRKHLPGCKAQWKIVTYHRPTYDVGDHRSKWFRGEHLSLFRKYKVDLTITAHSHSYQRFCPMYKEDVNREHPITHIITAGGGAPLGGVNDDPHLAVGKNMYHYMVLKVDGNTLSGKVFSPEEEILDSFTITKTGDSFDDAYLNQSLREEDFGKLRKGLSWITLPEKPVPGKPFHVSLTLASGSVQGAYEIQIAERSEKYYKMEPVKGKIPADTSVDVKLVITANQEIKLKRVYLRPALVLKCSYDIAGNKGSIYSRQVSVKTK